MKARSAASTFIVSAVLVSLFIYLLPNIYLPITCQSEAPLWMPQLRVLIRQLGYPGAQISYLSSNGKIFNCGVGWASKLSLRKMTPDSQLPYASLSKVFTSLVVAQLMQERRLTPDKKFTSLLNLQLPLRDDRINDISIRQLLSHRGGMDRAISGDPMFIKEPWCPRHIGDGLSALKLDFKPGERFAYSNLGYCFLGVTIEETEHSSLSEVFRRRLFLPASVSTIHLIGELAKQGDVDLYVDDDESKDSIRVDYSSMQATGAWVGSAQDFLAVLRLGWSDRGGKVRELLLQNNPKCPAWKWRNCHGLAFYTYQQLGGGRIMYWHDGSLPGVTTFSALFDDGSAIVFLSNSRRSNWRPGNDQVGQSLYRWISGPSQVTHL